MRLIDDVKIFENLKYNKSHDLLRKVVQKYKNDNGEIDFKNLMNDATLYSPEIRKQLEEEMEEYTQTAESILTFGSVASKNPTDFLDYQKFSMFAKEKILIQTQDEPRGDSEKIWVNLGIGSFLHRINKLDNDGAKYTGPTEIVVNKAAKQVGIECAEYDLSVDEDGRKGVISYNVLDKEKLTNPAVYSMDQIFQATNFKREEGSDGYYIEDGLTALDMFCKKSNIAKEVRDELIGNFLKNITFDISICQTDRHEQNTNFIYGVDKSGDKVLKTSPLIDNELSLGSEKSYKDMNDLVKLGNVNPKYFNNIDRDFMPKVISKKNVLSARDMEDMKMFTSFIENGGSVTDFFKNRTKRHERVEQYENDSIKNVLSYIKDYINLPKNKEVKAMYSEWVAYDLSSLDIYEAIDQAEEDIGRNFKFDEVYKQYTGAVFDERWYNTLEPFIEDITQELEKEEMDEIDEVDDPTDVGGDL